MAQNKVENLHLKVLYNILTIEGSTGGYIVVRHRPVAVSTFYENIGGAGEKKFATAPLKSCLNAICISSPELLSDPTRDHSIYVLDPLEALPGPLSSDGPSQSPGQGISVGMGLLKTLVHQAWDGDDNEEGESNGEVSVTGRVIMDRGINNEVVEVIVSLRENINRQASFLQQQAGSYYNTYNQPGVGITAYGSSPAHAPVNLCGTTTRRQQPPERRIRATSTRVLPPASLSASISGTAEKPIVLEDGDSLKNVAPPPQVPKLDDAALKEIATLLAQVDDPVQQATIMTILTAGELPGTSGGPGSSSSASLSAFSLIRTLSASLQKISSPKPNGKTVLRTANSAPVAFPFSEAQKQPIRKIQKEVPRQLSTFTAKQPFARKFTFKNSTPSSDPVIPPSSPTLAVRELAESYRQRGAARCAVSGSKTVLPERVEPSTGDSIFKPAAVSNTSSSTTSRSVIAPALALPGYRHTKSRSDVNPHPGSKGKRADISDENKDPSPKVHQDQSGEKKRQRVDSEQCSMAKKCRLALTDALPVSSIPDRPNTPPNSSTEVQSLFTPRTATSPKTPKRSKTTGDVDNSLFTPSPMKTPSWTISHQLSIGSKHIFPSVSSPLGGGPGFFSPFVPSTKASALVEPTTPSGSAGTRSRLFEDSGINLGWTDFAESDQQRLSVNRSSDPAELADASASIAAANSNRWLDLPPSSPPPPTSPLEPPSDLDFMNIESLKSDDPFNQTDGQDASTPNSDLGLDPSELISEHGNLNVADNVDPFEFFTSLGLTFPHETADGGAMSDPNFLVDGTDAQDMAQGMRELISGCVL